jgi:hypothetical protein
VILRRREKAGTLALPGLLALVVLFAGPFVDQAEAQKKSFELPRAEVVADVQPDGSVLVTEDITYLFNGSFEGGCREILLKDGMSVSDVSVSENGERYSPGASAELGSSGAPGTYGIADLGRLLQDRVALQGLRRAAHVHRSLSS